MGTAAQAGLGCQWPSLPAHEEDRLEKEAVENKPQLRVYTPQKDRKNYVVMMSLESLDPVIPGVLPALL